MVYSSTWESIAGKKLLRRAWRKAGKGRSRALKEILVNVAHLRPEEVQKWSIAECYEHLVENGYGPIPDPMSVVRNVTETQAVGTGKVSKVTRQEFSYFHDDGRQLDFLKGIQHV